VSGIGVEGVPGGGFPERCRTWSEDGEPKRTPKSQTVVLEGDAGPGCEVRSVV
jgi:hypothetical protein